MEKFLNIICLIIWISWFIYGIYSAWVGQMIEPLPFICATVICILTYIRDLSKC